MAFDLRKLLKQFDKGLLQQFFAERGELVDIPWKTIKKSDVEPIITVIKELPTNERREIQVLLKSMGDLSDKRGLRVVIEELSQRYSKLVPTFKLLKGSADKVLWTYLNARDAFEEALVFARADVLSASRYFSRWSSSPCDGFAVDEERIAELEAGLRTLYSDKELRGEACKVHHYTRLNGNEYFFAYLPDWPDNFMVFNNDNELESLDIPTAFTDLFVYEPSSGALEMIASGGNTIQQKLRKVFHKAMCQRDVEDAVPDKPEFSLDHLIQSGFSFKTDLKDRIEAVTVPQIQLVPFVDVQPLDGLQMRFHKGSSWSDCLDSIDKLLNSHDLSREQVGVDHIQIRLQFMGDGNKRGKTLKIGISPRSCNLKSEDDEELQAVGDRCLRRWRIIND